MPEGSRRRRRWLAMAIGLALVLGGYVLFLRYNNYKAAEQAAAARHKSAPLAVPVTAGKVIRADFPVYLESLGTAQAFNIVTIRSRVDGEIVKLAVKEGQNVKQGDLIAQIDPRTYQAALDQAKSKLKGDEYHLKSATLDLDRFSSLAKQSFAPQQQLDNQRSTVNQLKTQIASDRAAIETAETQLSYTTIRAPLTGRVGFKQIDQGNLVQANGTNGIITIAQIQPISVVFTAQEAQVSRINKALATGTLKVLALTADRSRQLATGTLAVVNNTVDQTSGTIQLKATFQNGDDALWPGLSVTTRLLIETEKNVVVVPTDALQHGPQGLYVFIVGSDNTVQSKDVKVGHQGDGRSVVTQGLAGGDRVVVAGQYRLQEGTLVKATDAAPPQTADVGR